MQIISFAISKGGTGKTTSAAVLAQAAAIMGQKVLLIDCDPQGNLSFAVGADTNKPGCYEFLEGAPAADLIQTISDDLDIIPASWNLQTVTAGRGSALRLQKALQPIREKYSLIIIDTPPTPGVMQYAALQASTGVIIPLLADTYSLQAYYQIMDTIRQIQASNEALKVSGIIITQYDGRSTLSRQMRDTIITQAEAMGTPYLGTVRQAVAVKEAAALQSNLYMYAPKCKPAADYLQICDTLMTR